VTEATRILQIQDKLFRGFPEVERVFGKIGRADTSTDPAPFAMVETTVLLKPPDEWRRKERWYSSWAPGWVQAALRPVWPDRISWEDLVNELDRAMRFPGWTNAWTMPIKARIDMLTTGVRTPVGIKIMGSDLEELERLGERIEAALQDVPGTRSVFAERVAGGYFFDFDPRREELARYGLTIDDVHDVIMTAIGGQNISTTIEGRERYPINIRYPRDLRDDLARLERVLVSTPSGANVPLAQIADLSYTTGPGMIRNENGMLASYVYVDFDTAKRDVGSYVADAKRAVNERVDLPEWTCPRVTSCAGAGSTNRWSA
jgi:Cu(I)/Ag(I) efflux system membrane protein CusA/SilA